MRTKITLIVILLFLSNVTMAIDPAYQNAMQNQLKAMSTAQTAEDFQAVANGFKRISEVNLSEWLPDYYIALTHTNAAFRLNLSPNEKDEKFNLAAQVIEKCIERTGENAELVALKGYALWGELSVESQTRGQQLSGLVMQIFGRALTLEPENPRAMAMMAQMQLGMSKFFGEGPEKACGMAKQSLVYFEKEEDKKAINPLLPRWGKESAQAVLNSCK